MNRIEVLTLNELESRCPRIKEFGKQRNLTPKDLEFIVNTIEEYGYLFVGFSPSNSPRNISFCLRKI